MPPITAPQIFDRTLLKTSAKRWQHSFSNYNFLYDIAIDRLLDRLNDLTTNFQSVLILGAKDHTKLKNRLPKAITASFLNSSDADIIADEEFLPFAPQSFDLIIAPPGLHQVNDLPGTLAQLHQTLKPDGFFVCALYGGETLFELRDSLTQAEMKLTGGLSPRIYPFVDKQQAGGLLQRAGFALPVVDSDLITVTYENTFKLYDDLRGMGERNIIADRTKSFTPRNLFMMAQDHYAQNHADPDGRLRATFEMIFIAGWAPHASQQKPLRPGSAEHSLAEKLGTQELKTGERVG